MHNLSIVMSCLCIILGFLCLPALFVKNMTPNARIPGVIVVISAVSNFFTSINTSYNATWESSDGTIILVTLGLVVGGFILYIIGLKAPLPVTDERKKELYDKCKEMGVNDLKTEFNRTKAKVVARRMGFPENAIDEAFEYVLRIDAEKEMLKNKDRDCRKKERLERFAAYSGVAKRRAMLEYRLEECHKALKENEKSKNYYGSMGKGPDPYIVGGIASAIGGAGAGLYAATETSIKNAQNESGVAFVKGMGLSQAYNFQQRKIDEKKQITDALAGLAYKIVSEHTSEECFSKLHFVDTKISITEAGSCVVDTDIEMDSFSAIEGMPTVIDGSVLGKIYKDDKLIGTATLVFGELGVSCSEKQHIAGIALFCGEQGGDYRVEFVPNKLWAMEK